MFTSFFERTEKVVDKLSAKSDLAESFRYTVKRQDALTRFVANLSRRIAKLTTSPCRMVRLGV